jgi:hypothetical protein
MGHPRDEEMLDELSPATIQSAAAMRDAQKPEDMSPATQRKDIMTHMTNRINMNNRPNAVAEDDVEESALQASFGIKKYGKKGMDKLRAAGQKHASEKTMQNIRAEYSDKEKPVTEDGEFAGDYATGEAGQWRNKGPKANKPATIGDLVGEGQDDLDTIRRLLKK